MYLYCPYLSVCYNIVCTYISGVFLSVGVSINQQFSGSTFFEYLPTDGSTTVDPACIDYYRNAVPDASYSSMSNFLDNLCDLFLTPQTMTLVFDRSQTTGTISTSASNLDNLVTMTYYFSITSANASVYQECNSIVNRNINENQNQFTNIRFADNIPANADNSCPEVAFDNSGVLTGATTCQKPYYKSSTNCCK